MAVPKTKGRSKVHEGVLTVSGLRWMSCFYLSVLLAILTTVTTTMATKDTILTEHHLLWRDTSLTLTADHLRYISKPWVEPPSEMNHHKPLPLQIQQQAKGKLSNFLGFSRKWWCLGAFNILNGLLITFLELFISTLGTLNLCCFYQLHF